MAHQRTTPQKDHKRSESQLNGKHDTQAAPQLIPDNLVQRLQSKREAPQSGDLLYLQRAIGNRATTNLLMSSNATNSEVPVVQRALNVGSVDNPYEREADRVAKSVMGPSESSSLQPSADSSSTIQREPIGPEGGQLNGDLEGRLKKTQNSGSPLSDNLRGELEPKLGANLAPVRVHTDHAAVQLTREVGAKAFTHKNHIYYGKGQSPNDMKLTAHEATHTIQQGAVKQVQAKREQTPEKTTSPVTQRTGVQAGETPLVQRAWTKRGKRKEKIRKEGNWNRKPTSVAVSSGGIRGGAVFVNFTNEAFVLKTSGDESPARALFAEKMLSEVGGLDTPDSVPIQKGTPTHAAILQMLDGYEWDNRFTFMQNEKLRNKFKAGMQGLRDGQYILVMKNLSKEGGGKGMGDELDSNDPLKGDMKARNILLDRNSQERIGITMALDFALGNADRFELMNLDNVFQMASGNLGAIDNDAILPKMPSQDKFGENNENAGWQIERWVAKVVRGMKPKGKTQWELANSSINDRTKSKTTEGQPMTELKKRLSDFDKWFDNMFRGKLELTQGVKFSDDPAMNTEIWDRIKAGIRAGLDKGLQKVESSMKGRKGRNLKSSFKKYDKKYQLTGMKERNFEWEALQVRQRFMSAINKGMSADEAETEALKYAATLFGLTWNA